MTDDLLFCICFFCGIAVFAGFTFLLIKISDYIYDSKEKKFIEKYPLYYTLEEEYADARRQKFLQREKIAEIKKKIDGLYNSLKYYEREKRKIIIKQIRQYRYTIKIEEEKLQEIVLLVEKKKEKFKKYIEENNISTGYFQDETL